MAGINDGKNSGNKWCKKMAGKLREKINAENNGREINLSLIKIHRSCTQ
jgi:hypothetical protein